MNKFAMGRIFSGTMIVVALAFLAGCDEKPMVDTPEQKAAFKGGEMPAEARAAMGQAGSRAGAEAAAKAQGSATQP